MKTFIICLLFITAILNFIIALLILLRNSRKAVNISFFAMATATAAWIFGIAGFYIVSDATSAITWAKFYTLAPAFLVAAGIAFSDIFPEGNIKAISKEKLLFMWLWFVIGIAPIILIPGAYIKSIAYVDYGKQVITNMGAYIFYGFYIVTGFLMMFASSYRNARQHSGRYLIQIKLFFSGIGIAALFGTIFNLILPIIGNYRYIWIGPIMTSVFVSFTAYGIVRHKIFDIRFVVAKALGYLLSVTLIASGYGFIVFGIARIFFHVHLSFTAQLILSLAIAFTTLLFGVTKKRFDELTRTLFYRDAYDTQDLFDEINGLLVSTLDVENLASGTAEIIVKYMKSDFCVVGLSEGATRQFRVFGTKSLEINQADTVLMIRLIRKHHETVVVTDFQESDDELKRLLSHYQIAALIQLNPDRHSPKNDLGYILLGPKKSGNVYNRQDIRALDTIAKSLIIAVQNALHYEEIQNFNLTLQQKVVEATNKLRRTNEKLRALDETKDDFISMASHQLRTPLTSVKGYLSMVLDGDAGKLNTTQKEMLGQAFFSSQRMVYLIADLLNVSRLKTGKFVIEPSSVNLANMVEEEMSQLTETAAAKSLQLTYDKPEDFPELMLDETKTRQVIMNFIDNAIYYTPAGGHIAVQLIDKPSTVELRVVDDGIGVPKSEQHHLFTKFYRAANARKARPDGTGLGLFMAKKVITAQNGATIFESQEGKGSTFGFIFSKNKLNSSAPTAVKA